MTSALRSFFGTKHRLALAIEEIDPSVNAPEGTPVDQNPSTEDTTVVMKGPLADVYSDALAKVYDKSNPDGGAAGDPAALTEPNTETGEVQVNKDALTPTPEQGQDTVEAQTFSEVSTVVLESQAIDAAVAASVADAIQSAPPAEGTDYETLYAIDEQQVDKASVADVTQILAEAETPESVTVLIDNVVPEGGVPMTGAEAEANKGMVLGLESMVQAMGGNVVRSYKDFIKARAEKKANKK